MRFCLASAFWNHYQASQIGPAACPLTGTLCSSRLRSAVAAPPPIRSRDCHRLLPGSSAAGFALPLATLAALVLLLASLATQSVLHQARVRNAAVLAQRQREDGLASAAQRLVGQVVSLHPCLLTLALEQWAQAGASCADAAQQRALREGQVAAVAYRLLAWQPASSAAETAPGRVHLELAQRSESAEPAWRAAFALDLGQDPARVQGVRELGLRGAQP